jgi:two-component system response regulator GlrR
VSCQTKSEDLLRAELFGDAAAPSAESTAPRSGAVQRAQQGTLLLHEIGDLPLALQALLVKMLREAARPCGIRPAPDGVRLICSTSRDLKALTNCGEFLSDLYCEINMLSIETPELGRRAEDIPLLISHFLEQAQEPGGNSKIYSREAILLLTTNDWPGNVRQLFELVKQNVALGAEVISEESVERSCAESAKVPSYLEARDQFARDYLSSNLRRTAGNVTRSARLAKRNRANFYKLLERYRLHPEDFKHPADVSEA